MKKPKIDKTCPKLQATPKSTGLRMDPDLYKQVKQYALDNGTSAQAVVARAVKEYLKRNARGK